MAAVCEYVLVSYKLEENAVNFKQRSKSVNKQIVDFIWSHKNPKIKKTTMISEKRRVCKILIGLKDYPILIGLGTLENS